MDDTFALWLTVIMLGVMIVGIIWMFTDRIVELRHRVNKLEIYRRLDEGVINETVQNMKTYKIVCPHCDKPHDWTYLKGKWVGLTEEEINKTKVRWTMVNGPGDFLLPFARAIEAKLKEKNA